MILRNFSDVEWYTRRDLVTLGDPEKTSLKTSFQEFISLRPAAMAGLTSDHWVDSVQKIVKKYQQKRPYKMVDFVGTPGRI